MITDAQPPKAGDEVSALFRTLHASLEALREELRVGGYDPHRVQARIAGAGATVELLEESVEASFSAMQAIAGVMATPTDTSSRHAPAELERALDEAHESVAAIAAARDLAADRHAETLERRDRVIASLHEELATIHAEVIAVGIDRDAAWEAVAEAQSRAQVANMERALGSRDAVINEMHHEIADVHAEALALELERDAGRARVKALEDASRLLQIELDAARAEAERHRRTLRDTLEAARTGRMAETASGWLPLTGRLERPGGGRVARKTSDHGNRFVAPTRPVKPTREDASRR